MKKKEEEAAKNQRIREQFKIQGTAKFMKARRKGNNDSKPPVILNGISNAITIKGDINEINKQCLAKEEGDYKKAPTEVEYYSVFY